MNSQIRLAIDIAHIISLDTSKEIRRPEKDLLYAAKNLDFEKAAALRDELKKQR